MNERVTSRECVNDNFSGLFEPLKSVGCRNADPFSKVCTNIFFYQIEIVGQSRLRVVFLVRKLDEPRQGVSPTKHDELRAGRQDTVGNADHHRSDYVPLMSLFFNQ